jgi:HEAT repeat protein
MSPQKTRRILSVFLASPGDVFPERNIAVEVVHRINKLIGPRLGWHIDLHRWEDTKPAYGRPQSIINPAVDACDLFIGLLWERWGQATGIYTSGFDEEFQRAKARRESTGEPEIWLVFKTPRPDKVADPGSELTKVLAFRDAQRLSHQILYREIVNTEDWRTNLYEWLVEHLFEEGASTMELAQQPPTESPPTIQPSETSIPNAADLGNRLAPDIPEQLTKLSGKVARLAESGNLESSGSDAESLGEFEVARLYLLSATLIARRYTSEFLGTHETNLLYKHRDRLELTNTEEFQLLRTVLHDASDVIPGWFWFRNAFPKGMLDILLYMATDDIDAGLRARALKLLAAARIQMPKELWHLIPLSDNSDNVSAEAFRYLGFTGDETALDLIEKSTRADQRPTVSLAATEAKFLILIRTNPKQAFSELLSTEPHVDVTIIHAFTKVSDVLPTDDLIKGAESSSSKIRELSVKELARRGELELGLAERLREDTSIDVKQIALQIVVNSRGTAELDKLRATIKPLDPIFLLSGRKEVDLNLIKLNYFKTLSPATLLESINWLSIDGPFAYKALATMYYDHVADVIRDDLNSGFIRIREKSFEELKSKVGLAFATEAFDRFTGEKLDDFIRSEYTEAALIGLASHSQPSDIQIARKCLRDSNRGIRTAAVKIVSKFGNEQDVQTLLDISDNAWGELEDLAPATAIRLSTNSQALAIEMARAGGRGRQKAAVRWLVTQDSNEVKEYFRGLLNDEAASNRVQGIQYLSKRLTADELKQLLDEYPGKGTYYYDVVTWLDRLLYAPQCLKEMFIRDLDQEVGANQELAYP